MKVRNLFFIPFLISNCDKISNDTQRDDTKVAGAIQSIVKDFEEKGCKTPNLNDDVLVFASNYANDEGTHELNSFLQFYKENKGHFLFLCNFNFSKTSEFDEAWNKFHVLIKTLIADNNDFPVILGQLLYIFEKDIDTDFNILFKDESDEDKVKIANVLNLVASLYLLQKKGGNFLYDVKCQNSRFGQYYIDKLALAQRGGGIFKMPNIESTYRQDKKIVAVRNFEANGALYRLNEGNNVSDFDINKIVKAKGATNKKTQAIQQLINLAAGIEHFAKDKNFPFSKSLIEILKNIPNEELDANSETTKEPKIKIFNLIYSICQKIQERDPNDSIKIDEFRILISKLKEESIKSPDLWSAIVNACDTDYPKNGVDKLVDKNYPSHVVNILTDQVLNSTDLAMKTLNLIPSRSIDGECFLKLLKTIGNTGDFIASENTENIKNLFRLLKYENIICGEVKTFDDFSNGVLKFSNYNPVYVPVETFKGMLQYLKTSKLLDANKRRFVEGNIGTTIFLVKCDDATKQQIKHEFGL